MTSTLPQLADELAARLARSLGDRLDGWRAEFAAIPRHLFVPARAVLLDEVTGVRTPIDRYADPEGWLSAVYSDQPVITQTGDGDGLDDEPSSSCSKPSVVLDMLHALDPRPGDQALVIGAGTGWTDAILACRTGPGRVASVEVDPAIAAQARVNIAATGRDTTVITADGEYGHAPLAPYDRVLATCSVEWVPPAWVEQAAPGGVVLTPWGPPMANQHLMRLDVAGDGSATGSITGAAAFMRLRSQRWRTTDEPGDFDAIAEHSTTVLEPREVLGNHARLAAALRMGECRAVFEPVPGGEALWLLAADSWASVINGAVRQAGPRRLWDEAVDAHQWWTALGSPARPRFRLTVRDGRQWVWLDDPGNVILTRP